MIALAQGFDGQDRSYLEAFGLGCEGKEREIYAALAKGAGAPEQWSPAFAWIAWRLGAPEAVPGLKARAMSAKLSAADRQRAVDALAFIKAPEASQAMLDLAANDGVKESALWWLNSRRGNEWKEYGLLAAMKERGLIKDKPLVSVVSPEPPVEAPPALAEVLALNGDRARGQTAFAACLACHKLGKTGTDLGPDLTVFGKTQPREVIATAILTPSKDISHGFEASRIVTKDGLTIDGIVLDHGDPLVLKSMGGISQNIERKQVQSEKPLGRSLMLVPAQLGLTAQTVADLVAYLQAEGAK